MTITLRSDPYVLFEGMHNEGESLLVTIPKAITPGFHTLDIYGTGIDGSLVNLREIVYVVATEDDYDGDGVPNSSDACISIWQNGIDEDADGQDDACDPQITTAAFPEDILPELPPVDTAFVEESANEESLYVNSLLVPYILPRNNSPEDSNSVPANPVKGASQTSANAAQSVTNREASAAAKSIILPNFGYVPTLQNGAVLTDFQGNSTKLSQPSIHTQRAVLGIASNPKSFDENRAISGAYTIVLAAPITVFLTALITRRVRRR